MQRVSSPAADAQTVAQAFAESFSGKLDGERTSVLIYLSDAEFQAISNGLLANWDTILEAASDSERQTQKSDSLEGVVKEFLKVTRDRTSAADIALFGRMLAEKPELNLDVACQVAHAISTHRVTMEMDFFTAVDDLQMEEETGSGHMGVTGFNSACFYRYSRIDWDQLVRNLDNDADLARRTVEAFLRASLLAIPTGKQNAFSAQNPPSFALAASRADGMSWSLANAFERPVRPDRDGGLVVPSIRATDAYWGKLKQIYGSDGVRPAALSLEDLDLPSLGDALAKDVDAWIRAIMDSLPKE